MKFVEAQNLATAIGVIQASGGKAKPIFGFGLALNAKALAPIMQAFEDARKEIIERHAAKDAEGQPVIKDADGQQSYDIADQAAFMAELQPLFSQDVSFAPHMIPLDIVPDLEPGLLAALMPIIEAPAS